MFATLPDFTPRDSHSLWYTSSRAPIPSAHGPYSVHNHADHHHHQHPNHQHNHASNGHPAAGGHHARARGHVIERTALARLAADEQYMHRRRLNVQNFGSAWLKPPGVPKTLHQMREEKREQEEHQEALRREQLAQELAEAEAAGSMPEDNMMDDVQLDGAQDLDDDIPDADDDHFGMGSGDDDDDDDNGEEDDDEGEGEEDDDDDEGVDEEAVAADEEALREERQNDLMEARMRMADDAFREALVRGDTDADELYVGDEMDPEEEEGDHGHMLDEDDFAHHHHHHHLAAGSNDGGMDADLDDDIPEAESGGYEHTDSEAELSSSSGGGGGRGGPYDDDDDEDEDVGDQDDDEGDDDDNDDDGQDIGFAPRAAPLGPPQSPTLRTARASLAGPRTSMDLSTLLSQDESSFMDSSPAAGRRARHG
ncbi:hypothetical protein JDV02_006425 [Purpureocillium takamizusanense]|uniref:Anaphase-promoting complex, subunit 15/MND2 n=1 Tax=Purpureocillium takamizusanense TaxID=2060973 RepID=A0A9Q8VCZ6_9HYPO|nr:uncharacterized protein JDV02_006425 [Purpureocillium takamizusanense]UNI20327.1 hypothetical protein JDV02_006425 [Purpureocillium takamizusanense]